MTLYGMDSQDYQRIGNIRVFTNMCVKVCMTRNVERVLIGLENMFHE